MASDLSKDFVAKNVLFFNKDFSKIKLFRVYQKKVYNINLQKFQNTSR
jgi:hypothetical protein